MAMAYNGAGMRGGYWNNGRAVTYTGFRVEQRQQHENVTKCLQQDRRQQHHCQHVSYNAVPGAVTARPEPPRKRRPSREQHTPPDGRANAAIGRRPSFNHASLASR